MDPNAFFTPDPYTMTRSQSGQLRKFQCSYCYKVLSSKQNFKEHTYIHTGEKPFRCSEPGCTESFRQGSQLSVHRKMHRQVYILQTRACIQIPKLTDMLDSEWEKNARSLASIPAGMQMEILPEIKKKIEAEEKLPRALFYME